MLTLISITVFSISAEELMLFNKSPELMDIDYMKGKVRQISETKVLDG
jgi:hypothetical protein